MTTKYFIKPGEVHENPKISHTALDNNISWRNLRDWINAMPEDQLDCDFLFLDSLDEAEATLFIAKNATLVELYNGGKQTAIVGKRY